MNEVENINVFLTIWQIFNFLILSAIIYVLYKIVKKVSKW